jgi:hypothetical protein
MTATAPKMICISVKRTVGSVIKYSQTHAKWHFGEMSGEFHGPAAEKNALDAVRFFEECEKNDKVNASTPNPEDKMTKVDDIFSRLAAHNRAESVAMEARKTPEQQQQERAVYLANAEAMAIEAAAFDARLAEWEYDESEIEDDES